MNIHPLYRLTAYLMAVRSAIRALRSEYTSLEDPSDSISILHSFSAADALLSSLLALPAISVVDRHRNMDFERTTRHEFSSMS
jgi:hypothetical protein